MKRPAGHSAQVGASPPTLCWPGPHSPSRTSETHFVRSPDACEPGGQGSQPEAPRLACTVFMGQLVQGSPAASRYVPGAHGTCAGGATLVVLRRSAHMAEPAALHWPVGHARQVLVRVALAGGPAILPTANKADFNTWVEFDGCCPLCTVSQQVNI